MLKNKENIVFRGDWARMRLKGHLFEFGRPIFATQPRAAKRQYGITGKLRVKTDGGKSIVPREAPLAFPFLPSSPSHQILGTG